MTTLSSKWGVELIGRDTDIANLEYKVNGSVKSNEDYFISILDRCRVLRTSRWDASSGFSEAKAVATEDLSLLLSCMYVLDQSLGIEIGTVFQFHVDGRIDQQRESAAIFVRVDRKHHASPATFKDLVDAARSSMPLRVAASELSAESGWFEVFKALEGLKRFYGTENRLLKSFPSEQSQIARMKRTANSFRHAKGQYAPVSNPISLQDAKSLMRGLITATLMGRKAPHTVGSSTFEIPNITSYDNQPDYGLRPLILGAGADGTAYVGDELRASE